MTRIHDVAVVGGGSAGSMAYLRSVLNFDDTVWLVGDSKSKKKSRGAWVFTVDNIPGMHDDPKPISNAASSTQKWVKAHPHLAEKSTVVKARVTQLERIEGAAGDHFLLRASSKKTETEVRARHVILATGVMDVQPLIGGSIEPVFPYANRGDFIYCVRCDGHHVIGKRLAVVGPPKTALGVATLMHERYGNAEVQLLTQGEAATEEQRERARALGMTFSASPIAAIEGDAKTEGLTGLVLEDGSELSVDKAIIALGTIVYNELAVQLGAELADDGRLVTRAGYETSVPGLFAVGDIVSARKMQIYTGWDEAVDAADTINRRLRAARRVA